MKLAAGAIRTQRGDRRRPRPFQTRMRDDARAVITELRELGLQRMALLSGDNETNVTAIAEAVGLFESHGDLVLMVGDGINDAPALSSASVGIALAARGGGISAEAADVVLLADHLGRVPEAIRISRRTIGIARQSIVVGLSLSVLAMIVAALGYLRPAVGAGLQEVIDVAVIVNALRTSR